MTASSRTLQHVGEWKVEVRASSIEELLAELARVIAREAGWSGDARREAGEWERITIGARDLPGLLVDWANELIGRSEITGRAFDETRNVRVERGATPSPNGREAIRMTAEVRGSPVHEFGSALKAATYHDAVVERQGGGWRAELLFDV